MDIQSKILEIIEKAKEVKGENKTFLDFAKLHKSEINELKAITGNDYTGYVHCIDGAGIIHALKHANINASDILLIPFIIENYDFIGLGKIENTIVYKKLIGNEYFYVEEIRTGRKKFAIKTLYKRKKRKI